MPLNLTLGAMSHTKPMEEYLLQVINYKKIEGRLRNRYWLLVSDGHDCSFCLLQPHLNYLIKDMLLQRFTVIKARFLEVKSIAIKKVLFILYQLPLIPEEESLFFIQDISIVPPEAQVSSRIISSLKNCSTLRLAHMLHDPEEVQQLEIPGTLEEDINKLIKFIHD
jgi:hypothetical protein